MNAITALPDHGGVVSLQRRHRPVPCLYCGGTAAPRAAAAVLPDELGAVRVPGQICATCAGRARVLEAELVRAARLILMVGSGDLRTPTRGVPALDLPLVERALARTALGFIALARGPQAARADTFAWLRRAADEQPGPGRVVTWLVGGGRRPQPLRRWAKGFARGGHHTVLLAIYAQRPVVTVSLFGRPFAAVWLTPGPAPAALPRGTAVALVLAYQSGAHEIVDAAGAPGRFYNLFSPGRERDAA
ncbi:MAG TPA: hypothetical protein VGQ83_32000 [Polyangia bacterium]|jgi:hypothetical protein